MTPAGQYHENSLYQLMAHLCFEICSSNEQKTIFNWMVMCQFLLCNEYKKVQVLTQKRGRWTPIPVVSPTRCRGNSGGDGTARSCGRSGRCRSAASPAGWAGRPASSPLPPHLPWRETGDRHLLAPRYSSSSPQTPHLSVRSPAPGVPWRSWARARCRRRSLRLCDFAAWHHQRRRGVRWETGRHSHVAMAKCSRARGCLATLTWTEQ